MFAHAEDSKTLALVFKTNNHGISLVKSYLSNGKTRQRRIKAQGSIEYSLCNNQDSCLYKGYLKERRIFGPKKRTSQNQSFLFVIQVPYQPEIDYIEFRPITESSSYLQKAPSFLQRQTRVNISNTTASNSAAQQSKLLPLVQNGPKDKRINLIIVSEGYTLAEQDKFQDDANTIFQHFYLETPFKEYRSFFNVFSIFVPSNESGIDYRHANKYRDTYFDTYFENYGSGLDLEISGNGQTRFFDVILDHFNNYNDDIPILLINDATSAGVAINYQMALVTAHSSMGRTALHEIGHLFGELGDEYSSSSSNNYPSEHVNATRETRREHIKWNHWILDDTPIPTPDDSKYNDVIGLFEGAQYRTTGWYRPKRFCAMNTSSWPFCQVCREALILSLYDRMSTVNSHVPEPGIVLLTRSDSLTFTVDSLYNNVKYSSIQWYLDGWPVRGDFSSVRIKADALNIGDHLLSALIKDNTALVRKDTRGLLANEAVWIIRVNAQPAVASNENMSGPLIKNIYPNPYNNVTAISYEIPNSSRVEVSVYDIGGQLVKTLFYGPVKAGDFYTSWNGKDRHGFDLSSGSYLIKLKADKGTDIKKVMLVR